ncbi:hypothetical protein ACWDZX_11555 [Streptomyces collinus]
MPPSDLRRSHGACRHSKPAAGATTYPPLEVFDRVGKKCDIILPARPDARGP